MRALGCFCKAETHRLPFSIGVCLFIYLYKFICLFIYWPSWVFVAARGLSLVVASGGYSLLWCAGFSLRWLLLLRSMGSRCASFSSCGTWASVAVARGLQ